MGLQKGHTNNPKGRPQGSKNKINDEIRERINAFITARWEGLEADFEALEPKERLQFFEKLLSYTLSKPQSFKPDNSNETETPSIQIVLPYNGRGEFDPSRMTDDELRAVIAGFKEKRESQNLDLLS